MFKEIVVCEAGGMESMFHFDVETGALLDMYRCAKDIAKERKFTRGTWRNAADARREDCEDVWIGVQTKTWRTGQNPLFLHCTNLEYAAREWNRLRKYADDGDISDVRWPQYPGNLTAPK